MRTHLLIVRYGA